MAFVYPGDPGSGSTQTQNNNYPLLTNISNQICRGNNFKLNSSDPAAQYQTQKIIQNTVRVSSSLYTWNLGALNIYQKPSLLLRTGVNWNQMSDRALPHYQTNSSNSQGSFYHGSSTRHTQTRERPGAGTPGGAGVDIKHNSYCRYLGRLKAKRDIRRGVIPPTFGAPIPFSQAFPIYGGKTVKTAIVSGCNCPDDKLKSLRDDLIIYRAYFDPLMFSSSIVYQVGQYVYARLSNNSPVLQAQITQIDSTGTIFTIQFVSDASIANVTSSQIIPYFPCNCSPGSNGSTNTGYIMNGKYLEFCDVLNSLTGPNYIQDIALEFIPGV